MNIGLIMYLANVLSVFGVACALLTVASVIGFIVGLCLYGMYHTYDADDPDYLLAVKVIKLSIRCFIVFILFTVFTPGKDSVYAYYGYKVITSSETAQAIGEESGESAVKALKVLNQILDEKLEKETE